VAVKLLLLAVIVLGAAGQARALAGTVTLSGAVLEYSAADGEANRVFVEEVSHAGFEVLDITATVAPGPGCTSVNPHEAFCAKSATGTVEIHVLTGDMDDFIQIGAANYSKAHLEAGEGADELQGGWGHENIMEGGLGPDIFHGHGFGEFESYDVVDYSARTAPLTVTAGDGLANDGQAGEDDQVGRDVNAIWGGSGADTLSGKGLDFFGLGGDDKITVSNNAFAYGGDGNDELSFLAGGTGWVILHGGAGRDVLRGGPRDDSLYGDVGNDVLRGGAGPDFLLGALGADEIVGEGGFDLLVGGSGPDTIEARDHATDRVQGGDGHDRARVDRRLDLIKSIEEFF
jgi:Ca2+-binding RTX toxin-like protein